MSADSSRLLQPPLISSAWEEISCSYCRLVQSPSTSNAHFLFPDTANPGGQSRKKRYRLTQTQNTWKEEMGRKCSHRLNWGRTDTKHNWSQPQKWSFHWAQWEECQSCITLDWPWFLLTNTVLMAWVLCSQDGVVGRVINICPVVIPYLTAGKIPGIRESLGAWEGKRRKMWNRNKK